MTIVSRRQFAAGAAVLSLLGVTRGQAQDAYPQRPVRLIVPMRRVAAPTCSRGFSPLRWSVSSARRW